MNINRKFDNELVIEAYNLACLLENILLHILNNYH